MFGTALLVPQKTTMKELAFVRERAHTPSARSVHPAPYTARASAVSAVCLSPPLTPAWARHGDSLRVAYHPSPSCRGATDGECEIGRGFQYAEGEDGRRMGEDEAVTPANAVVRFVFVKSRAHADATGGPAPSGRHIGAGAGAGAGAGTGASRARAGRESKT